MVTYTENVVLLCKYTFRLLRESNEFRIINNSLQQYSLTINEYIIKKNNYYWQIKMLSKCYLRKYVRSAIRIIFFYFIFFNTFNVYCYNN